MISYDSFYDTCHDALVKTDQLAKVHDAMQAAKSDEDRIKVLMSSECVPDVLFHFPVVDSKSYDKSQEKLLSAEGAMLCEEYAMAVDSCNAALKLAPHPELDSIYVPMNLTVLAQFLTRLAANPSATPIENYQLFQCYSIRSAALYALKEYRACINDVARAIRHAAPGETHLKLVERAARCFLYLNEARAAAAILESAVLRAKDDITAQKLSAVMHDTKVLLMNGNNKKKNDRKKNGKNQQFEVIDIDVDEREVCVPPLADGEDKAIKGMSKAMQVKYAPDKGRYLVANRDIDPGEVLMVRRPYISAILPRCYSTHCFHCCKRTVALVPCPSCDKVVFCDEECRWKSWTTYHHYDCHLLDKLDGPSIGMMALLVFRMALRTGIPTLLKFYKNCTSPGNDFNGTQVDGQSDSVDDEEEYSGLYDQVTNTEGRSGADLLKRSITSVYLARCLHECGFAELEDLKWLPCILLHHMQSSACNSFEIGETIIMKDDPAAPQPSWQRCCGGEVGSALYTSLCLLNHSCYSNGVRIYYGNVCVLRASRPILAGEEVSDNYGYHFEACDLDERQEELEGHYYFKCSCIACVENWPSYENQNGVLTLAGVVPPLSQLLTYRCPYCIKTLSTPVPLPLIWSLWNKCAVCKKDLSSLARKLEKTKLAYRQAYKGEDLGLILQAALDYLKNLVFVTARPNREMTECHQVAKKCWILDGSKYYES